MKIAESMASTLNAKVIDPEDAKDFNISEYDLIGFGSGICFGKTTQVCLNLSIN